MSQVYKVVFNPFRGELDYIPVQISDGAAPPTGEPNVVISNVPCDSTVIEGDIVIMVSGVAFQADASTIETSNAVGIAENKLSSTLCDIRVIGVTADIYSGLDTTKDYYLSDTQPGKLTIIPPTASGTVLLRMGQAFTSTSFLVNKSLRVLRS